MNQKETLYILAFKDIVESFKLAMSYPELPTIDIDAVISQILPMFEDSDKYTYIHSLTKDMVESDWLISNQSWANEEEEFDIKQFLHNELQKLAKGMYEHFKQVGLHPTQNYSTQLQINEYTFAFKRI
jgi:phosphoenolpyruvate carboxylase